MKSLSSTCLGIFLCLAAPRAQALALGDGWTLKGFGTFGASGTDTDRLGFRRDVTQSRPVTRTWGFEPDSRLGLQLDAHFNDSWHATAQWVARSHVGDFAEQNLDWAFLRWHASNDLQVRLGRMGFDVYMLADYRNVGYAYLWSRPPHEFYAGVPLFHFDGADITHKFSLGEDGYLTLKAFGGRALFQVTTPARNRAERDTSLAGGNLGYENGDWRFRLSYAYVDLGLDGRDFLPSALDSPGLDLIWPGLRTLVSQRMAGKSIFQYGSLGLSYDDGVWQSQGELFYFDSDFDPVPSALSGYVSLGQRFGKFTPYVLLSAIHSINRTTIPEPRNAIPLTISLHKRLEQFFNAYAMEERSVSLGVRWDLFENVAFKAQWSHFWLGDPGTELWVRPERAGPVPEQVNVWSLGVDFTF